MVARSGGKPFGGDEKARRRSMSESHGCLRRAGLSHRPLSGEGDNCKNILTFRFFQQFFEDNWGKDLIEKIYVRELENVGAEDRGPFYESVGALRDVGQNHLLEMVALITMDQPARYERGRHSPRRARRFWKRSRRSRRRKCRRKHSVRNTTATAP